MSNKEAEDWLKSIKERIHGGDERYDQKRHEALDMAISALESIEQIREEIEREADHYDAYVNADIAKGLYYAGEIIDKYTNGGLTQAEIKHYNKLAEHYDKRNS